MLHHTLRFGCLSFVAVCDQELLKASNMRRACLAAEREILVENIEDWKKELAILLEEDGDGQDEERSEYELDIAKASSKLAEVRGAERVRPQP